MFCILSFFLQICSVRLLSIRSGSQSLLLVVCLTVYRVSVSVSCDFCSPCLWVASLSPVMCLVPVPLCPLCRSHQLFISVCLAGLLGPLTVSFWLFTCAFKSLALQPEFRAGASCLSQDLGRLWEGSLAWMWTVAVRVGSGARPGEWLFLCLSFLRCEVL